MKVLRGILILIVTVSLLINTSCSNNSNIENDNKSKLVIYVMENDTGLRKVIKQYNDNHKECTIQEKIYFGDQYEKYSQDMQSRLSAGIQPDIVVASPNRLPMLSKYIESGTFSNLDELFNSDKSINKDDYFAQVMNYGIYKSNRYLVPLSYSIDALFSTRNIMQKGKINSLNSEVSWEDISQVSINQNKGSYLLSNLNFSSLIRGLGTDVIDIENKRVNLDSTTVKDAIKLYKSIDKSVLPQNEFNEKIKNGDISLLLKNGNAIFLNSAITPQNLWYNYLSFNTAVQPEVYAVNVSDKKIPPKVGSFAAINSNCTNKKEAYEFISMLLSMDYQLEDSLNGIPVSKSAYEQKKDECLKGNNGSKSGGGGGSKINASMKKLLSTFDEYIAKLDVCKLEDYQIYSVIDDRVREGISNKETDESISKALQEVVEKYFKEALTPEAPIENKAVTADNSEKAIASDNTVKAKLSITYMDYDKHTQNALRKSKELYPGIEFTETVFEFARSKEMETKLSTELMAGAGPDIIVFNNNMFNSLSKVADSGTFTDLNELINKDEEFNKSDYYENIFDCGIYKSKRAYIPLNYSIPHFKTTALTLKKNNIVIGESGLTFDSLHGVASDFLKNRQDEDKYLLYATITLPSMMQSSGIKFIDTENHKSNFNTKEFITILKTYKEICPAVAPFDICMKYKSVADMIKEDKIVMKFDSAGDSPESMSKVNSEYKGTIGNDMDIIPIGNKGVYYATPGDLVGINSNCKNKEAAFKILKIMLSKDLQKSTDSYGINNINFSLPINKHAYNEDIRNYLLSSDTAFGSGYSGVNLPKRLAQTLGMMIEKAKPAEIMDIEIQNMLIEAWMDYLEGTKTPEQTAKIIDDKVSIYLNE